MRKDRIMDIHDRATTFYAEPHVDDTHGHGPPQGGVHTIGVPFNQPTTFSLNGNNDFMIWEFDSTRFPNGVTIIGFSIFTPVAASTYLCSLVKYTSPTDESPVVIETITTSASYTATDNGAIDNPDIAAGDLLYARIPITFVEELFVRVTFTID